jgi:hypothetical protein
MEQKVGVRTVLDGKRFEWVYIAVVKVYPDVCGLAIMTSLFIIALYGRRLFQRRR